MDVTPILGPGVYVLRSRGCVVFVGYTNSPISRLHAHVTMRRGDTPRNGLPGYPVIFDEVEVRSYSADELERRWREICAELKWDPVAVAGRNGGRARATG